MSAKYIFVTGGVVSSLGKGLAAASIGCLLESRGLKVNLMKFDPYLNVDPGTMSPVPARRGLRHRRRRGNRSRPGPLRALHPRQADPRQQLDHRPHLRADHHQGAPRRLSRQDRPGHPARHQRDQDRDEESRARTWTSRIVEIGGTVGDIESLPFLEAIRQMRQELGRENTLFVHVTLVPCIAAAQELKTKPTQHSVKEMLSIGIQPDILLCRTDRFLSKDIKAKIALFCNVEEEAVITAKDVASHLRSAAGVRA